MDNTHDQHESFIKTPQQLVVVILLAFLVPIIGILLVVQLVLNRPGADPNALTPEAVSARIQPVARIELGAPSAAPGARAAADIVKNTCAACHQTGAANAPKLGNAGDWAPRIKTGVNAMVQSVIKGKGAMPPKAGDPSLTDGEIHNAVVLMANQAGAKFKEKPRRPQHRRSRLPPRARRWTAKPCMTRYALPAIRCPSPTRRSWATRPPGRRASRPAWIRWCSR